MKKILLPILLITVLLSVIFLPRFLIKVKINCQSQYGNCPQSTADKLSLLSGRSMFRAKPEIKKILESDFLVSDFSIQFKLPYMYKVDLVVRQPVFALKDNHSGAYVLIDDEGRVLADSNQNLLPVVVVEGDLPKVGESVNEKELLALKLIAGVYKMYQTDRSKMLGDTLLVDLPGGVRVIFPLVDADRELLLGSLRLIYSNIQSKEGGSLYSEIDLRYINPVLR